MKITEKTNIYELIKTYPLALDILISKGFLPLKSKYNQKTIAKFVNLKQACALIGLDKDQLIKELNMKCVTSGYISDKSEYISEQEIYPIEFDGDISVLGIVPCPVRNVTIEAFDKYTAGIASQKGKKVSWLFYGENPGVKAIEPWITSLIRKNDIDKFPDIFMAVGSKLFLYNKYFRIAYEKKIFHAIVNTKRRPELKDLEDPNGCLNLQYCVLFSFLYTGANPDLSRPQSWTDLADPSYKNSIFFPDLDLPVIADLLCTIYSHLGHDAYLNFLDNIQTSAHPAKSIPRWESKQEPSVIIAPLHFLKMNPKYNNYTPLDGYIAIPAYTTSKETIIEVGTELKRHFLSADYLKPYWDFGSFIPNISDINVGIDLSKLIIRPWSYFLCNDPDKSVEDIINLAKRRTKYESFNN